MEVEIQGYGVFPARDSQAIPFPFHRIGSIPHYLHDAEGLNRSTSANSLATLPAATPFPIHGIRALECHLNDPKGLKRSASADELGTLPADCDSHATPSPAQTCNDDSPLGPLIPDLDGYYRMLTEYKYIGWRIGRFWYMNYTGDPKSDKNYLFLFCELKGVPENYEKVLADMNTIEMWNSNLTRICKRIISSEEPSPNSLVVAKQIVAKYKLELEITDMLACLKDLYFEWAEHQKILGYKKFEEFLLNFWKEYERRPKPDEIMRSFCTGSTCAVPSIRGKACPVSKCDKPGLGKHCCGMTFYNFEQLEEGFFKWLFEGGSVEKGKKKIERVYKRRLMTPCKCRANYIKAKLEEARKSGLTNKIEQLIPSFGDLAVRNVDTV